MNKNGFSEIFRCKEFAEKARGCFGSNKGSKIANMFRSRNLDICLFAKRAFKAEEQSVNTFVLYFHPCVGLKQTASRGLTD